MCAISFDYFNRILALLFLNYYSEVYLQEPSTGKNLLKGIPLDASCNSNAEKVQKTYTLCCVIVQCPKHSHSSWLRSQFRRC